MSPPTSPTLGQLRILRFWIERRISYRQILNDHVVVQHLNHALWLANEELTRRNASL